MASNNAYGPQIVTDGLVLCLDANNTKSHPGAGDTWYDLSGLGHDGLIVNTTAAAESGALVTKYFSFDGTDDGIRRDAAEKGSYDYDDSGGEFTVCAWLKPTTFASAGSNAYLGVFNRTDLSNHLHSCFLSSTSGTGSYGTAGAMASWIHNTGGTNLQSSSSNGGSVTSSSVGDACVLLLDNWNFCVWRWAPFAGWRWDLFNSAGHVTATNDDHGDQTIRTDTTSEYRIGTWSDSYYEFTGGMSVVRQYNRKLTDAEIKRDYNALRSRFGL